MSAPLRPEPAPVVACTVSRDVQAFDLLIEDMEASLGERWGDLGFAEALAFLDQPDAQWLDFLAVALGPEDEADLSVAISVIGAAKAKGIKVILIAEHLSPASLHQLLREGGDEFVPYPLPEGELSRAIARVVEAQEPTLAEAPAPIPRAPLAAANDQAVGDHAPGARSPGDRSGVVIPVHSMAGGTGATTLAVNLAWELATLVKGEDAPRVCLMDLGLQWGAVATLLDLPRRESVLEMLSDVDAMDGDTFMGALVLFGGPSGGPGGRLQVLTAPHDLVPLDLVSARDVARLVEVARVNFDYVVIDMPPAIAEWTEAVLGAAHLCLATLELDLRSAQSALRFKRALVSEGLPFQKFRFCLNRAPGFADLSGKARVKRLAESVGIAIEVQLPDGGRAVTQGADQGVPLAQSAPKNPLRREIAKLARSIHAVNQGEAQTPPKGRAFQSLRGAA